MENFQVIWYLWDSGDKLTYPSFEDTFQTTKDKTKDKTKAVAPNCKNVDFWVSS